jgi:hypothetical protein
MGASGAMKFHFSYLLSKPSRFLMEFMKPTFMAPLLVSSTVASAAVAIVDVNNSRGGTKRITSSFGQTFTPTMDGMLSGIRLNVAAGTHFTISVWEVDASGSLLSKLLGRQSFASATAIPTYSWAETNFPGGIPQTAGKLLAFTVTGNAGFVPAISTGSSYAGGSFFEFTEEAPLAFTGADLVFQTMVVPVPEPGICSLAFCVSAIVLVVRRRSA